MTPEIDKPFFFYNPKEWGDMPTTEDSQSWLKLKSLRWLGSVDAHKAAWPEGLKILDKKLDRVQTQRSSPVLFISFLTEQLKAGSPSDLQTKPVIILALFLYFNSLGLQQ